MPSTDPIADALTKIRNASRAGHPNVDVPHASFTERVLEILKQEGYLRSYKPVGEGPKRFLRVYLKYTGQRMPAIRQLIRISKPGLRTYRSARDLPRVLSGLGVAVISTSKGVMTEREAYRQRIGGEVVCYVW